jgi:hypothetical protein
MARFPNPVAHKRVLVAIVRWACAGAESADGLDESKSSRNWLFIPNYAPSNSGGTFNVPSKGDRLVRMVRLWPKGWLPILIFSSRVRMIVFEGVDRSLREGVVFKFVSSLSELNAVIARRDRVGESQGSASPLSGEADESFTWQGQCPLSDISRLCLG